MRKEVTFQFLRYSVVSLIVCCTCAVSNSVFSQDDAQNLSSRDPFESQLPRPAPKMETQVSTKPQEPIKPPELIITGVVSGGAVPQVVIKGKVLRIGDHVEGATISDITKEGVKIQYSGQVFFIPSPSKLLNSISGGKNDK